MGNTVANIVMACSSRCSKCGVSRSYYGSKVTTSCRIHTIDKTTDKCIECDNKNGCYHRFT
ncbi:MAG: hypothetical protein ACW98X_18170 [Promethearchaeota archaeon]